MNNKLTREDISNLPYEVKTKVINTLKVYDEVTISYEDGLYNLGTCIKANYSTDHEVIGTIYASDYFTEKERIENYINEFYAYPTNYKGKRDFTLLRQLENSVKYNFENNTVTKLIGAINNSGDFEICGTITLTIQ